MTFQKRHFRLFAFELFARGASEAQIRERAHQLRGTNPKFDEERFIAAALTGFDKSSRRAKSANVPLRGMNS